MTALLGEPIAVVSLAVALGGVLFLLHGWRRTRQTVNTGERIDLVTSRYLGGKKVLTLIEVEGERLLLALSGDSVQLVARLAAREQSHVPTSTANEASPAVVPDAHGCIGEGAP